MVNLNKAQPLKHSTISQNQYDELYNNTHNNILQAFENIKQQIMLQPEMLSSLDTDFSCTENRSKGGLKISHCDKNIELRNRIRLIN
jgi:hypothetical protein